MNNEEISRLSYKARIEWYKKRAFEVSEASLTVEDFKKESDPDIEEIRHTPDELISILDDLVIKSQKLEDKISFLCRNIVIPIDKDLQPEIFASVSEIDGSSKGEYISYSLYDSLLKQTENADNSVDLNYVVSRMTGDSVSDSIAIQDKISSSYNNNQEKDNAIGRYANRWLNNIVSWNEHDYKIRQIINFSDNYLDLNPDPAYVPWKLRRDVGEGRIDAGSLSDLWKHFSENYKERVNFFVDGISGTSNYGSPITPSPSIGDLTTRSIKYNNNFLERANQALDIDFASQLVCCFIQWGIRLDTKTLKGMRALLQLLQTGLTIDFRDVLNGIKDIFNNIFRGLLCYQMVSLIDQIIKSICDPIKRWINTPQQDIWNRVFACTPIDELINRYLVDAMDYLQDLLAGLMQNWYKQIEIKNIKNNMKVELLTEQKWIGEIAKMIDSIIAVTEMAAKCGVQFSPNSEETNQLVSNYNLDQNPDKYVFPEDPNPTVYNSFIGSNPSDTRENSVDPKKATKQETGVEGGKVSENNYETFLDCLKKIPVEYISGVAEWSDKSKGRP